MGSEQIEATKRATEDPPRKGRQRLGYAQLVALLGAVLVGGASLAAFDEARAIRTTLAAAASEGRALRAREDALRSQAFALVEILPVVLGRARQVTGWEDRRVPGPGDHLAEAVPDRVDSETLLAWLLERTQLLRSLEDRSIAGRESRPERRALASVIALAPPASAARAALLHRASSVSPWGRASGSCGFADAAFHCLAEENGGPQATRKTTVVRAPGNR
jgi:hypothetical protein